MTMQSENLFEARLLAVAMSPPAWRPWSLWGLACTEFLPSCRCRFGNEDAIHFLCFRPNVFLCHFCLPPSYLISIRKRPDG